MATEVVQDICTGKVPAACDVGKLRWAVLRTCYKSHTEILLGKWEKSFVSEILDLIVNI